MDQIKLENFRKEYGFEMPIVRSLPAGECLKLRENLLHKFSLNDIDEFFKIDKFSKLDGFNADEENFDLMTAFSELGIAMPNEICINFNKFVSIDILRFNDLLFYSLTIKNLQIYMILDNHTIFIPFKFISFNYLFNFK